MANQTISRCSPGDGIGKEVMPEGLRVVEAAARKFGADLAFTSYDWSCDYYAKHGRMMPEDWFTQLRPYEAMFYGAVGWPATVPDHVSLWGSLIKFRRDFDQYVNMRPCKLMPGIRRRSPTASRATSTSWSCARTRKASTRRWAAACTRAATARSCSRSPSSRARASTA
jgi:isocitrate/isopropylmalate dehydrogenase